MFCCGDGTCLDSDKVCDINQHCADGSDERQSGDFSLVQISADTVLSLVDTDWVSYDDGTKFNALTTHFKASKIHPSRGIFCI